MDLRLRCCPLFGAGAVVSDKEKIGRAILAHRFLFSFAIFTPVSSVER